MSKFDFVKTMDSPSFLIEVEQIITVYYNEFNKSYTFDGEQHDFWELVYVDKGELEVSADSINYQLSEGDIIFHQPNEFHTLVGNGVVASNVLVISFVSKSKKMDFFKKKIMKLTERERILLGNFLKEAKSVFVNDLGPIYQETKRLSSPLMGAEQMMYLYLQQFLITLVRFELAPVNSSRSSGILRKHFENKTINQIIAYLEQNISQTIYLDDVCNEFYLSKTYLKRFFKKETGYTVMNYLKILRMEKAKKLIREADMSFTEIAQQISFDSVHYFSTSFKKYTNLSPSEYANSIKNYET